MSGRSEPEIHLYREPTAAELSRSAEGGAVWKVEQPQHCFLYFDERAQSTGDVNHALVVDGVRFCVTGFRDSEDIEVEITTDYRDLFIDVLHLAVTAQQSNVEGASGARTRTRSKFRLGLLLHGEIVDSEGSNRLRLYDVSVAFGRDFHSLQWECARADGWHEKLRLTRRHLQNHSYGRLWISELHSFEPKNGTVILRMGEEEPSSRDRASYVVLYSWRKWDLHNNLEVERLKNCNDPFEPLD